MLVCRVRASATQRVARVDSPARACGLELSALGTIATGIGGVTSSALRDLAYDLADLQPSRLSLGEDACPGYSPSWENN